MQIGSKPDDGNVDGATNEFGDSSHGQSPKGNTAADEPVLRASKRTPSDDYVCHPVSLTAADVTSSKSEDGVKDNCPGSVRKRVVLAEVKRRPICHSIVCVHTSTRTWYLKRGEGALSDPPISIYLLAVLSTSNHAGKGNGSWDEESNDTHIYIGFGVGGARNGSCLEHDYILCILRERHII